MFIDKARIYLKAGDGGDGCLAFRREKYVELGGPSGGSGGKGGDIYLKADPNKTTLIDFTYKPHFKALSGEIGQGKNRTGRCAKDIVILIPAGTVVYKNGKMFHDFKVPYEQQLAAKGGRGGKGNAAFKTQRNTAPHLKENGESGEETTLVLELKLIADVGLVGFPNAGKSSILSKVSAARPKIADYPFTTLTPNLGVVSYHDKSFVIADIPGIIRGAHEGKGLGFDFLRHIERTRVLVHVIDMFGFEGDEPWNNFMTIHRELAQYGDAVGEKPRIIAMNKADLYGYEEHKKKFLKKLKAKKLKYKYYEISALTGHGLKDLIQAVAEQLYKKSTRAKDVVIDTEITRYTLPEELHISRDRDVYVVSGSKIEKVVFMTPMDLEESVQHMRHVLQKLGVDRELVKQGIKPGDTVRIGAAEFEWV